MATADEMPKKIILKALLMAKGAYVSGEALAKMIGVSRVTIWKYLDALAKEGYEFEALRNKGYKLLREPAILTEDGLRAHMDLAEIHHPLYFLKTIDSTNTEGQRRLVAGCSTPGLVVAQTMGQGKGRLGRVWAADDPNNLYFSFVFRPDCPPRQMMCLSLWVGLSVCEWIEAAYDVRPKIKWPNDLLLNGKKIAGMLAEASIDADWMRTLVFGIGLNVNSNTQKWPENLRLVATSLSMVVGRPISMYEVGVGLMKIVFRAYQQVRDGSFESAFLEKWKYWDALAGQTVTVLHCQEEITGVASGVDISGGLILETVPGKQVVIHAGDVTLKKMA